jgi:cell division protein FtsA
MSKNPDAIVGLDIGTTKICAVVGEVRQNGISIIGHGVQPSRGIKKGVIINMDSTVESIRKAVEEAEAQVGFNIRTVLTGISGSHIKGFNNTGVIPVKDREIKKGDVRRAVDAAKSVVIPMDREVIHILPQEFVVDDQDGIKDPVGLSGGRLEARVHIVTGAVTSAQNIIRCTNRTGLNVKDIVLQQLASGESVLSEDERELGVMLIDIGGGTTDIAIFSKGSIRYTAVLPLGGDHITSDIAVGIRTPLSAAEDIKKHCSCSQAVSAESKETVEVPAIGESKPRPVAKKMLCQIIQPRMEEILTLVQKELLKSGFREFLSAGAVITGGTALLKGITELAEQVLRMPVRIGYPRGVSGLDDSMNNPMYATGVGLVLFGTKEKTNGFNGGSGENAFTKISHRMQKWFEEVL